MWPSLRFHSFRFESDWSTEQSSGACGVGNASVEQRRWRIPNGTVTIGSEHCHWTEGQKEKERPVCRSIAGRCRTDWDCGSGRQGLERTNRRALFPVRRSVFSACAHCSYRFNGARNRTNRRGAQNDAPADGRQQRQLQPNRFYLAHSRRGIAVSAADRERWPGPTARDDDKRGSGQNRDARSERTDGRRSRREFVCCSDTAVDRVAVR